MKTELQKLLKAAKSLRMSREQQEEQRKSFAYGNAGLENELITREMINQQAEKLKSEDD